MSLLVDYMKKTSEVKSFVSGWSSAIQFELSGEDPFGLVFAIDGSVNFKTGKLDSPDVIFYSDSNLFFQVITGKVDQDEAFSNGLVDVRGSIFDSVKFRHAAELTQEKHNALFSTLRAFSRFA